MQNTHCSIVMRLLLQQARVLHCESCCAPPHESCCAPLCESCCAPPCESCCPLLCDSCCPLLCESCCVLLRESCCALLCESCCAQALSAWLIPIDASGQPFGFLSCTTCCKSEKVPTLSLGNSPFCHEFDRCPVLLCPPLHLYGWIAGSSPDPKAANETLYSNLQLKP